MTTRQHMPSVLFRPRSSRRSAELRGRKTHFRVDRACDLLQLCDVGSMSSPLRDRPPGPKASAGGGQPLSPFDREDLREMRRRYSSCVVTTPWTQFHTQDASELSFSISRDNASLVAGKVLRAVPYPQSRSAVPSAAPFPLLAAGDIGRFRRQDAPAAISSKIGAARPEIQQISRYPAAPA